MAAPDTPNGTEHRAFEALSVPGFRAFLLTFFLTMMADNVEHVISYWVIFQKFDSAALGGFAVVSHWLPFLLFSVGVGALNDRFDSRRLIQIGLVLFIGVSAGWGYFFVTGTLQIWHAMVLLVLHGCAGVLWTTSSQMLLYDIVGAGSIVSAVRLNATARYLGTLMGPGVGSVIMRTLGPTYGIFLNTLIYVPAILWLMRAPYKRVHLGAGAQVRGLADIVDTFRVVRVLPAVIAMVVLAGTASFFIGNSYQAQMPAFAKDFGHGDPGAAYSALLAADAAGALLAGLLLELRRGVSFRVEPAVAIKLAMAWAFALGTFALAGSYPLALVLLFAAGFFELSFSSMAQSIVQVKAPTAERGRILGLFNMASAGLRTFSGVMVGIVGSYATVHRSLALASLAFFLVNALVLARTRR